LAIGLFLALTAGCGSDTAAGATSTTRGASAVADLAGVDGKAAGQVKFFAEASRVIVEVTAQGVAPVGFHGFHIHSIGKCEAPFTSAGGHLSASGKSHPEHSGDMPVLLVNDDGRAEMRFDNGRLKLEDLFDADGTAVIVHAGADNYGNVPTRYAPAVDLTTTATGDAGPRIACGVIKKT
jgi:Cu-Zn family superoxide dismutase